MLYASSRDDLMMALGSSYFKGQYQCTEPVELTYTAMMADVDDTKPTGAALSEAEKVEFGATNNIIFLCYYMTEY